MPSWDQDSPRLRKNLAKVLAEIVREARQRKPPAVASAKHWQALFMKGLTVPDARFVGAFRGEPGLENVRVRVGAQYGVHPANVASGLAKFETKLRAIVAELDAFLPPGRDPDADELEAILELCAWVHAEWVRIHPLANGNGRTARLRANSLAMRYGLPPFVRLRPRPNSVYAESGASAMRGDWKPTALAFRRMLDSILDEMT